MLIWTGFSYTKSSGPLSMFLGTSSLMTLLQHTAVAWIECNQNLVFDASTIIISPAPNECFLCLCAFHWRKLALSTFKIQCFSCARPAQANETATNTDLLLFATVLKWNLQSVNAPPLPCSRCSIPSVCVCVCRLCSESRRTAAAAYLLTALSTPRLPLKPAASQRLYCG